MKLFSPIPVQIANCTFVFGPTAFLWQICIISLASSIGAGGVAAGGAGAAARDAGDRISQCSIAHAGGCRHDQ
jgi:hypothetical protein